MADGEEVTLDGRPLHLLRVADLKAALERRGLAKSGQKSALVKRLRGVRRNRGRGMWGGRPFWVEEGRGAGWGGGGKSGGGARRRRRRTDAAYGRGAVRMRGALPAKSGGGR